MLPRDRDRIEHCSFVALRRMPEDDLTNRLGVFTSGRDCLFERDKSNSFGVFAGRQPRRGCAFKNAVLERLQSFPEARDLTGAGCIRLPQLTHLERTSDAEPPKQQTGALTDWAPEVHHLKLPAVTSERRVRLDYLERLTLGMEPSGRARVAAWRREPSDSVVLGCRLGH
jgi:hypothetical protein